MEDTTTKAGLLFTTDSQSVCPYCGRALEKRTGLINGMELFAGYVECNCEGAEAEREELRRRETEDAYKAKCEQHRRNQEKAGIPKRFLKASTDRQDYIDAVASGRSLVFSGGVGTGKTFLACAIASALVDNRSVVFTNMTRINDARFSDADDAKAFLGLLGRCHLLVLDDLGKEKSNEWILSLTYRVIDTRYNAELPVIVTSNYSLPKLGERLAASANYVTAQAIVSRLCEMCGGKTVHLGGGDRRLEEVGHA